MYGNLNEPNYPAEKAERFAHKESFEEEKTPCFQHRNKGYKKGCKNCNEENLPKPDNDSWMHDINMEDK
jgi:hypothetical protein